MKHVGSIFVGWKQQSEPSEIARLARVAPELLSRFPIAAITCVDSMRSPDLTMPSVAKLQAQGLPFQQLGDWLVTTGPTVVRMAIEFEFFWGFDELWLFDHEPVGDMPENLEIRSDEVFRHEYAARCTDALTALKLLGEWMERSGAVMGLADGLGLCYAATEEHVAELLDHV